MRVSKRFWRQAVHPYNRAWNPQDWLLPVQGNHAYRLNPYNQALDNPNLYGLQVCCCPMAVYTLGVRFGAAVGPEMEFLLQSGQHIAQIVEGAPFRVFYFILCDPARPFHLRFLSLPVAQAVTILRRQTPLADYFHLTQAYT